MNKIIGTAGHVDHGKSELIKALTGIAMMRLPEEKKREMTIDLGFGFFKPNDDITIGVIDVPGHERFIRNMVAGMWSLDLVMLVVCANEGWMNMTEEHAKVALALGIKNIVCVINKIDLVDDNKLKESEDSIKKNLYRIFQREIEIIKVSALNGTNIDLLKERVTNILINDKTKEEIKTHIYVDRVFSIKGAGLTITGSIKGGDIKRDDTLIHYPTKREVSIRNIQSYHQDREIVHSTSRVALNLKNIKKEEIRRGHLLCSKEENVFLTDEIILELLGNSDVDYLRKIKNAEFAIGTECLVAQIIPLYKKQDNNDKRDDSKEIDRRFIRLKFDEPIAVFWKERGILISHGGSAIIGTGDVFWGEKTTPFIRKNIMDRASDFLGKIERKKYTDLVMSVNGYSLANGNMPEYAVKLTNYFVKKDYLKEAVERIKKLIEVKKDGFSFEDIKNYLNIETSFTKPFIDYLLENKIIMSLDNNIYKKYVDTVQLTNSQKMLIDKLKKEDLNGLDEKTIKTINNGIKDIKTLTALKYATYLDEGLYYHTEVYNRVKSLIMKNTKKNDIITIALVKERTGLSRKYTIPILNALEREKLVKRQGNDRIVL